MPPAKGLGSVEPSEDGDISPAQPSSKWGYSWGFLDWPIQSLRLAQRRHTLAASGPLPMSATRVRATNLTKEVGAMLQIRQSARRQLAISMTVCLTLASVAPNVVLACEGASAEQKVSLTPIVWSGTGKCPEKEGRQYFSKLGQWCEYELKNENKAGGEKLKILKENANNKSAECEMLSCVGFPKMVEAGKTECNPPNELQPGEECRERLEYKSVPAPKNVSTGFLVKAEWRASGTPVSPEYPLLIE